ALLRAPQAQPVDRVFVGDGIVGGIADVRADDGFRAGQHARQVAGVCLTEVGRRAELFGSEAGIEQVLDGGLRHLLTAAPRPKPTGAPRLLPVALRELDAADLVLVADGGVVLAAAVPVV